MSIVLQSSSGGSVTINEPTTASNFTQTLPAATGTVALTDAPTFTGQVVIPTINLTGGQIVFPATQSASANANTLDDYEEGTWTPTIGGGGGNPSSVTYNEQSGRYTKIGRVVTFTMSMQTSARTGGSGSLQIQGLPFIAGAPWQSVTIGYAAGYTTAVRGSGYTEQGDTKFFVGESAQNGTNISVTAVPTVGFTHIMCSGTYMV